MPKKHNAADLGCHVWVIENRIEIEYGEFCTVYTGTREDLIAAGVADKAMFPSGRNQAISNLRPEVPLNRRWITRDIKHGRFEICQWHERRSLPRPPASWNPQAFRENVTRCADASLQALIQKIAGDIEAEDHDGIATHRFADADQQRIRQLHAQLIDVIRNARIEPAQPAQQFKLMGGG